MPKIQFFVKHVQENNFCKVYKLRERNVLSNFIFAEKYCPVFEGKTLKSYLRKNATSKDYHYLYACPKLRGCLLGVLRMQ